MTKTPTAEQTQEITRLRELVEYAGVKAEEQVCLWRAERRRQGLAGNDAYGGAMVILTFADRKLLNSMRRAGLITKGTYPGDWILGQAWEYVSQEAGVADAMAETVADVMNADFAGQAQAQVHSWLS